MTSSVRHLMPFKDKMTKYRGEMEFALYAAEQLCPGPAAGKCHLCDFISCEEDTHCALPVIREHLGDHVPPGEPVNEIGVCEHGEVVVPVIVCHSEDPCDFMVSDDGTTMYCGRETKTLAQIEELEAWQKASLHDIAADVPEGTEAGK